MANTAEIERLRENWQDEVDSASEYRVMAENEPDPKIAKVYASLAKMEEAHVAFWEERLRLKGSNRGKASTILAQSRTGMDRRAVGTRF